MGLSILPVNIDIIQNKVPDENIKVVKIIIIVYDIIYNIWSL
jgi:hypothetical protein